jgi:hypothetical protein
MPTHQALIDLSCADLYLKCRHCGSGLRITAEPPAADQIAVERPDLDTGLCDVCGGAGYSRISKALVRAYRELRKAAARSDDTVHIVGPDALEGMDITSVLAR